jgi:hypothetical protein
MRPVKLRSRASAASIEPTNPGSKTRDRYTWPRASPRSSLGDPMKLRFSLRVLLLFTAAVAALGYWRHRPRVLAEHFADALAAGDYRQANSLLLNPQDALAGDGDLEAEFWARPLPQTFEEWFAGKCRVEFIGKGTAFGRDGTATATARGIAGIRLGNPANSLRATTATLRPR